MAAAPAPQAPTSKWMVEYADAQCLAQRKFGTPDKPIYLVLKQPPVGSVIQIALADSRGAGPPTQLDGEVAFDAAKPVKVRLLRYQPEGTKLRSFLINLPLEKFAGGAQSMRIRTQGLDERFLLPGLGSALKAMGHCTADLQKVWNILDETVEREPIDGANTGKLRGVFSGDDYPVEAMLRREGGTAKVAVLVDEQGRVADCTLMETSGVPLLDAQTCILLKSRARFAPARGSDGNPIKSGFQQRITWRVE